MTIYRILIESLSQAEWKLRCVINYGRLQVVCQFMLHVKKYYQQVDDFNIFFTQSS